MLTYFDDQKQKISVFLKEQAGRNGYAGEVTARLCDYAVRGKMVRGGLAVLGCDLFEDPGTDAVIPVAAALELFQSALLIHDDIMDRDDLRRGEISLHREYAREAAARSLKDPDHVGIALAICAGDIAFFMAFQLISESGLAADRRQRILGLLAGELQAVGAAQMKDVTLGAASPEACPATEEEIIDLYRFKTARYSFSLPLSAGALAAGRGDGDIAVLDRLGEALGIIFQIKDDDLGLFGDETAVGKPVGSDIREGKKTIMYGRLIRRLAGAERERFFRVFGNRHLTDDDVGFVRDLVVRYGIRDEMNALVADYAKHGRRDLSLLSGVRPRPVGLLKDLLAYSVNRIA